MSRNGLLTCALIVCSLAGSGMTQAVSIFMQPTPASSPMNTPSPDLVPSPSPSPVLDIAEQEMIGDSLDGVVPEEVVETPVTSPLATVDTSEVLNSSTSSSTSDVPRAPRYQFQGVELPFESVVGYPREFQGVFIAEPASYAYSNPEDTRIVPDGSPQCDVLFVTNLGISMYEYAPITDCKNLTSLDPYSFLLQLEGGDVAYGTEYTVYYALLDQQCTGSQEGTLVEVSSEGQYQCLHYKRDGDQLKIVYGYVYNYVEDVQCPQSWDVNVQDDLFADSSVTYVSVNTGVYSLESPTCTQ